MNVEVDFGRGTCVEAREIRQPKVWYGLLYRVGLLFLTERL